MSASPSAPLGALALLPALLAIGAPEAAWAQGGGLQAALEEAAVVTRDVRAREGDTLVDIARREYGNAALARPLAEFNAAFDLGPYDAPLAAGQIVRLPIRVPARGETALVAFVKGEVRRAGIALERGDLIAAGDVIRTGLDGFASIVFSSGSLVNLQPDTEATIARLACLESDDSCLVHVDTAAGELIIDVETREGQPIEFRVNTPYASAAVRGTEFDLLVDAEAVRAAVTEGELAVEAQQTLVELQSGFGSVTREGEPPGQAQALPPSPVLRTVPTRAAAGESVVWFPLSGVSRYALLFSIDEAGTQRVAEFEATGERFEIPPELASEDYYLSLRGVDESGLPGFRAVARLGLVDIDTGAAPVEVEVTREGQDFLVAVIDPAPEAAGFEIQVSATESFEDPLSVDVAQSGRAVLRVDTDTLYARARTLIDPRTVAPFGPVASGN